ncbi:MAG: hypothetical protein H7Z40_08170 [Phycisphaerae bacterium]|nr:hypothetical protein [Gemmatimonadaceae bacterium]
MPIVLMAQPTRTDTTVAVRELTIGDVSPHVFANIFQVRQIAARQVLVNDGLRRQLLLLDDKLAPSRIVLDSVAEAGTERYGPGAAPIIAALSDTTWFVDRQARALLVIDPVGKVVRTTAGPPQPMHLQSISMGRSGVDAKGNLLFRAFTPPAPKRIGDTTARIVITEARPPATAPILRADFETRGVDTLGHLKQVSGIRVVATQSPPDRGSVVAYFHPLETLDDWAVLADGSVAIVRGADYHVDLIRPDGRREAGPKLAFDWKSISETEKQRIVDSTRAAVDSLVARVTAQSGVTAANTAVAMMLEGMITNLGSTPPTPPPPPPRTSPPGERAQPPLKYEVVSSKELPDYYPPVRQGAAQADADGNLWILPNTSAQSKAGELVYDVVSGKGDLTERVRLPLGRSIAGFGKSGIVYLVSKEADGWRLERASVRR